MKCRAIRKAACRARTATPMAMESRRLMHGSRARSLEPLSLDFFDQDILDLDALDRPEREGLGRVLNSLREMLLVVLHHVVCRFVAVHEVGLSHEVHHEAPHCFLP